MATQQWFSSQLDSLGLSGLDGVYEYLESMPLNEVPAYLDSLIGSSSGAVRFREAYVSARLAKEGGGPSEVAPSSSYADIPARGPASSGRGRKASKKRGRGGGRGGATRAPGGAAAKPSFAEKAAPPPAPQKPKALSDVERSRAKVREYRRSKKIVNCLSCGFIERALREDGACSFCQAPMFPIAEEESSDLGSGNGGATSGARSDADAADAQKNKLLAFDRTSARRTTVHDDDSEYFDADSNNWLTADERAAAYAKRDAETEARNRRSFNVTIDLAGKRILTESKMARQSQGPSAAGSGDVDGHPDQARPEDAASHLVIGEAAKVSTGGTGEFCNPLLPGPSPQFSLREGEAGSKWLSAVLESSGPPVTGRVQREAVEG